MDVREEIARWFGERVPEEWSPAPDVTVDPDEILVVLTLDPAGAPEQHAIAAFRERTRQERIEIAAEAEGLFNRTVSWGAQAGETRVLFTHLSIPVMTRLRLPERAVLDTLVAAGVARSRSHALAWCARLVAQHQAEWLGKLREATAEVDKVRAQGPAA